MIEDLTRLLTEPAFPSLHVLVIHFPIALICLAPFLDLGCLVLRSRVWLDRTATLLYVVGTIGAGAAYLTGDRAVDALGEISPAAEATLADHHRFAVLALIVLVIASLLRLTVSWLARNDRRISLGVFRLAALPIVLAGLLLIALAADRGGQLVYGHGLGVGLHQDPGAPK